MPKYARPSVCPDTVARISAAVAGPPPAGVTTIVKPSVSIPSVVPASIAALKIFQRLSLRVALVDLGPSYLTVVLRPASAKMHAGGSPLRINCAAQTLTPIVTITAAAAIVPASQPIRVLRKTPFLCRDYLRLTCCLTLHDLGPPVVSARASIIIITPLLMPDLPLLDLRLLPLPDLRLLPGQDPTVAFPALPGRWPVLFNVVTAPAALPAPVGLGSRCLGSPRYSAASPIAAVRAPAFGSLSAMLFVATPAMALALGDHLNARDGDHDRKHDSKYTGISKPTHVLPLYTKKCLPMKY